MVVGLPARTQKMFAGDTFRLSLADDPEHPQADDWSLTVRLAGAVSAILPATFDSEENAWKLAHTASNAWGAGATTVFLEWNHTSLGRDTEDVGRLTVLPQPGSGTDVLSQAERIVAAIDATMLGKATDDVRILEIAGRRLETFPPSELLALREKYSDLVAREKSRAMQTMPPARIVPRWYA